MANGKEHLNGQTTDIREFYPPRDGAIKAIQQAILQGVGNQKSPI